MLGYFTQIKQGIKSIYLGMRVTWQHALQAKQHREPIYVDNPHYFDQQTGIVTLEYPFEKIPVPDHGRYQLHNEIDDCIVCDKCAVICPVNCIDIIPIKSPVAIGTTSDGTTKRLYAATFDIDMAKCCFCGLCTSVCPTECLTMTDQYDFSTYTVKEMNFSFADMTTEQIVEKKAIYDQFLVEKEQLKASKAAQAANESLANSTKTDPLSTNTSTSKDTSAISENANLPSGSDNNANPEVKKPVGFKPKFAIKPKPSTDANTPD